MATSRRNVYIEQGRVVDRPSFVFDWTRFLVIIFLGAVFFLTNPGNDTFHSVLPKPFSKLLLRETTVLPSPSPSWRWTTTLSYSGIAAVSTNTNYGIFSLQKRSSAISISGMLHVVPLCRLDDNYSPAFYVCDILAKSMCHGKPLLWDSLDRVHTAHRVLCLTLLMMALFQFCIPQSSPPYWKRRYWYLDYLSSALLVHSSVVYTLLDLNLCVYPALQDMDRMITTLKWQLHAGGNPQWTFGLTVLILVILIGSGANTIATLCVGRYTYGWGPIVAASLSYSFAVGRTTLFRFGAWPVIPVQAFWTRFASIFFRNVGGGLAWLLGGLAGYMLGEYHQGNQSTWGYFYKTYR